jgi:hypothetical protein
MEFMRVQKKTNALEVLSCGGVSSTDSSDSSDSERNVNVYPGRPNVGTNVGSNLGSPPPPPPPPPPNFSEDSDSKPFDVTRFENMLKAFAEKATEGSSSGVRSRCSNDSLSSRRSCFYALSARCLDASDGLPKWGPRSQGVRGYLNDLHGLIATVEETDAGGGTNTSLRVNNCKSYLLTSIVGNQVYNSKNVGDCLAYLFSHLLLAIFYSIYKKGLSVTNHLSSSSGDYLQTCGCVVFRWYGDVCGSFPSGR